MDEPPGRGRVVLVSEPDAGRRRAWMAALRAAGVSVRGASGAAERAKALADGAVVVELSSEAGAMRAPVPVTRLWVPPDLPAEEVTARVRARLAGEAPPGGAAEAVPPDRAIPPPSDRP